MACFLLNKNDFKITIPQVEEMDGVTIYIITVRVGQYVWTVRHRYRNFDKLHEKLVTDHCVTKDILPPKKIIGNRDPAFVEKRKTALEVYLSDVVHFLQHTMPRILIIFLDFHKYDILFLLQEMSVLFLNQGELILAKSRNYTFNPLQLHAVSERLKQPCPPPEIFDKCHDFSHVLDFCSQLLNVTIEGSWNCFGTSNIVPNRCAFELSVLKEVEQLTLKCVAVYNIYSTGTLRRTLKSLTATQCSIKTMGEVLLCDAVHKDCSENIPEEKMWINLAEVDFSQNKIKEIDKSVLLMPAVERLTLNENEITEVNDLTKLEHLTHLYLSANRITNVDDLSTRLGSIVYIDLSQNRISSLKGFSNLTSLEGLDLGSNIITDVTEVQYIKNLPKFDYLILTGNPVSTIVDYRAKVLEHFERRAANICLDNEKPSQKELDYLAVMLALKVVKEGRTPTFSRSVEPTFPNSPQ